MFTAVVENRIKAETGYTGKQLIDELWSCTDMAPILIGAILKNAAHRLGEVHELLGARIGSLRDNLDRNTAHLEQGRWNRVNECGIAHPLAAEIDILAGRLVEATRPFDEALNMAESLLRNQRDRKPASQNS